jgi:hypothetical protein
MNQSERGCRIGKKGSLSIPRRWEDSICGSWWSNSVGLRIDQKVNSSSDWLVLQVLHTPIGEPRACSSDASTRRRQRHKRRAQRPSVWVKSRYGTLCSCVLEHGLAQRASSPRYHAHVLALSSDATVVQPQSLSKSPSRKTTQDTLLEIKLNSVLDTHD